MYSISFLSLSLPIFHNYLEKTEVVLRSFRKNNNLGIPTVEMLKWTMGTKHTEGIWSSGWKALLLRRINFPEKA